jgi:hypothetical protein
MVLDSTQLPENIGKPLSTVRQAKLAITLDALAGILHMPEGYRFISASYRETSRILDIVVASEDLPEVSELGNLPSLHLSFSVEVLPEDRQFKRITAEISRQEKQS